MKFSAIAVLTFCVLMAVNFHPSCAEPERSADRLETSDAPPPPCDSCGAGAPAEEYMARLQTDLYQSLARGSLDRPAMVLSPAEAAELAAYIAERHREIEGVELTEPQAAILAGCIVGIRAVFQYAAAAAGEK